MEKVNVQASMDHFYWLVTMKTWKYFKLLLRWQVVLLMKCLANFSTIYSKRSLRNHHQILSTKVFLLHFIILD